MGDGSVATEVVKPIETIVYDCPTCGKRYEEGEKEEADKHAAVPVDFPLVGSPRLPEHLMFRCNRDQDDLDGYIERGVYHLREGKIREDHAFEVLCWGIDLEMGRSNSRRTKLNSRGFKEKLAQGWYSILTGKEFCDFMEKRREHMRNALPEYQEDDRKSWVRTSHEIDEFLAANGIELEPDGRLEEAKPVS